MLLFLLTSLLPLIAERVSREPLLSMREVVCVWVFFSTPLLQVFVFLHLFSRRTATPERRRRKKWTLLSIDLLPCWCAGALSSRRFNPALFPRATWRWSLNLN